MRIKEGIERTALRLTSLEENIELEDEVRVIDKIVEILDMEKIGFKEKERKTEAGRPRYDEKVLMKMYVYGYRQGIRSGRKLEKACKYDIRFQWLMEGLTPDANTINDFRKDHKEEIKKAFYEINRMYIKLGLIKIENGSQDGFKIKASNSKEKNYTVNKVTDRIKREKKQIELKEEEIRN